MACCNKRKSRRIKNVMKQEALMLNALKYLSTLKNTIIKDLKNKTLSDYHLKTHTLYSNNIKSRPLKKKFINEIVELHNSYSKELIKRNMKHNSPLNKV